MGLALLLPPASGGFRATDLPTWVSTTHRDEPPARVKGTAWGTRSAHSPVLTLQGPVALTRATALEAPCPRPVDSSEPGVQVARNQHGRAHQDSGSREQPLPRVAAVRASPPTLSMAVQKESEGADPVARLRAGRLEPKQWVRGSGGGKSREKGKQRRELLSSGSPDMNLFLTEKPLCFPAEGKQ